MSLPACLTAPRQSHAAGLGAADGMQEVWINVDSARLSQPVRLHGLWLPQRAANAPVLLYLHGARFNVRSSAHRMQRMHELGFAVVGQAHPGSPPPCQAPPRPACRLLNA